MNQQELDKRRCRAENETLVIAQADEGYKVYSATMPSRWYQVTGTLEAPACSCPDFQTHHIDPEWRCKHILAVFNRNGKPPHSPGAIATAAPALPPSNGRTHMFLKRSVSPDGRIDSLSVEFSCPADDPERGDITARAAELISIQDEIVTEFLGPENGQQGASASAPVSMVPPPAPVSTAAPVNGQAVPAILLSIDGVNGRSGRRLCLTFNVSGRTARMFGDVNQLANAIGAAGYPNRANPVVEGVRLEVPCRVVAQPARDPRYVDIVQVLPAAAQQPAPRVRR